MVDVARRWATVYYFMVLTALAMPGDDWIQLCN